MSADICERLATERRRVGYTPEALAELAGVSPGTQRDIEAGHCVPSPRYLAAITATSLDTLYIVTGEHHEGPSLIGQRIRSERVRLGLTLQTFAALAFKATFTVIRYEQGLSAPNARDLAAWAAAGADVQFIITGIRAGALA